MEVTNFKREYLSEAEMLAHSAYAEEKRFTEALPMFDNELQLSSFADNDFSVAAVDNNKIVGFLCSYPPFNNAFGSTNVTGVFSPMGANAAIKENREKIYAAMYQTVAEKWVRAGAVSHAICIFAHDEKLQHEFYRLGFGLRCIDAIRKMNKIQCSNICGYDFVELPISDCGKIYPLFTQLYQHYQKSPFFMNRMRNKKDNFIACAKEKNSRYFAAYDQEKICAYFEVAKTGETYICDLQNYLHICGAYCLPQYRGKGIVQNLLNYTISTLETEGYTMLGVDFESFNPTAYGFWTKYFIPYTHSIVRRIDERILDTREM
ncbi:MAG: GNAT family N-acetyltransferase [Eubacteriales bacterium]